MTSTQLPCALALQTPSRTWTLRLLSAWELHSNLLWSAIFLPAPPRQLFWPNRPLLVSSSPFPDPPDLFWPSSHISCPTRFIFWTSSTLLGPSKLLPWPFITLPFTSRLVPGFCNPIPMPFSPSRQLPWPCSPSSCPPNLSACPQFTSHGPSDSSPGTPIPFSGLSYSPGPTRLWAFQPHPRLHQTPPCFLYTLPMALQPLPGPSIPILGPSLHLPWPFRPLPRPSRRFMGPSNNLPSPSRPNPSKLPALELHFNFQHVMVWVRVKVRVPFRLGFPSDPSLCPPNTSPGPELLLNCLDPSLGPSYPSRYHCLLRLSRYRDIWCIPRQTVIFTVQNDNKKPKKCPIKS